MDCYTSYEIKIKHYNHIFKETVSIYNRAVDFFLEVALTNWMELSGLRNLEQCRQMELYTVVTKKNPNPKYDFSTEFYKFPCYLRRAAINEALGMVSSYHSNLANWESTKTGKAPSVPKAGHCMPTMYRNNCFVRTGTYTARIKVYVRNTWDWLDINLNKGDVDYISRRFGGREEMVPTLQKVGKQWFLRFAFKEKLTLTNTLVQNRLILSVDLGINNACVCSIMDARGTIHGRRFLRLTREQDSLHHALNRIKKSQQSGSYKTPRLWVRANGINKDIATKTATFLADVAAMYNVDVIVFEHLDLGNKKRGSKKQRLALWKARAVQSIVANKAHRMGIRISHVNAWGTSRLAFDGSGKANRGTYLQHGVQRYNYSVCVFPTGKTYHCDLNASYNIGARYLIREHIKSLSVTARLALEAKVPQVTKRSTCTLSVLHNIVAVLDGLAV